MVCQECGNDNDNDVEICTVCGQAVEPHVGTLSTYDSDICSQCGATQAYVELDPRQTRFCGECGNQLNRTDTAKLPGDLLSVELPTLNFMEAGRLIMTNYLKFSGRSRRSEYWWFQLFVTIVQIGDFIPVIGPVITSVFIIVLVIPSVSVTTRRLHDIGKSGWWQAPMNVILLFSFYSMVSGNMIALPVFVMILSLWIYWLTQKGNAGQNYYGSDPRLEFSD